MKVIAVKAKFAYTYNLGNYSNVRPEVELTAELEEGDDPDEALVTLRGQAREHVHAEIDQVLESDDQPPKFYRGPLFKLVVAKDEKIVTIVPSKARDLPGVWDDLRTAFAGFPYTSLVRLARRDYSNFNLIDCSDGNFGRLPAIHRFTVWRWSGFIVLGDDDMTYDDIPVNTRRTRVDRETVDRVYLPLLAELGDEASRKEQVFVDVTDGDFSKLADMVSRASEAEAPAPVEQPVPGSGLIEAPFDDDDFPDVDDGLDEEDGEDDDEELGF